MEYINHNPKIFIISGKARSGKNTVATIICERYKNVKCKKLSYAYYLKKYLIDISSWDGSEDTKPRDLLQDFGTNFLKNKINKHFLINRTIEDIKVYSYFYDVIIISDARLIEEIEIPKKEFKNVITIRINKDCDNNLTDAQKNHITETSLDNYGNFDFNIENNDNYEKLYNNVNNILEVINEK